jgi:hypothetical protein
MSGKGLCKTEFRKDQQAPPLQKIKRLPFFKEAFRKKMGLGLIQT